MAYLTKRSRLLFFLSALTIVDCSGMAPEETYVSRLAVAQCTWARSCCEVSELLQMLGLNGTDAYSVEVARQALADQGRCVDLIHARFVTAGRTLLESIRSGRTKLDTKKLDACIQQFDKAKDGCTVGIGSKALTDACKDEVVFVGQQTAGAICYLDVDCAPETTCWQSGSSGQPGICRTKAADAAACRSSDECPEADSCSPVDARDSWCSKSDKQASGQFCSIDDQCADGLFCDTNAQACATLRAGGEECFQDRQCTSNRCNKDLRTCVAQAKTSEPCASSAHCEAGLWCDTDLHTNSCAAPLATAEAGAACSALPCKAGLACIGAICRSPLQDGATCSHSSDCQTASYCDSATDTCKPRKAKSASCSATADCAAGLYCSLSSYVCVDRIAAGQACTSATTCIEGTRCNLTGGTNGTCDTLLAAGSSCNSSSDCTQGLRCEPFAGRCGSRVTAGAMCENSDACPAAQYCGAGGGSVCQKALKMGLNQNCNNSSTVCDDGLYCSSGSCRQKVPVDGPCSTATNNCVAGAYCRYYQGTYTCALYAALGAPCTTSGTSQPSCQPGTVCAAVTDGGMGSACEPGHSVGQICYSTNDCTTGLNCVSYTCSTPVAEGGTCQSTAQCATGLDCNLTTGHCTARLAENASCAAVSAVCATGLYCRTFAGSCVARIAESQTCQSATACDTALECTPHNVCRAKALAGEQCRSDRPCATGLRCDAEWGKCVALQTDLKLGATCRDGAECLSGVCTNQECTGFCQGVSQ